MAKHSSATIPLRPDEVSALTVSSPDENAAGFQATTISGQQEADLIFFAQVEQARGRRQTATLLREVGAVTSVIGAMELKKSRAYRGKTVLNEDGQLVIVTSWKGYCSVVLGRSVEQVDEDIRNLDAFGARLLDSFKGMDLPYRAMRELRKLPANEHAELLAAADRGDKATLVEIATDIKGRHEADLALRDARLEEALQVAAAKDKVLAGKDQKITELAVQLERKFKPSADTAAQNDDEQKNLDELHAAEREASVCLMRLAAIAAAIIESSPRQAMIIKATTSVEFVCQRLADITREHGIQVQFEEMIKPSWVDDEAFKRAVAAAESKVK